MNKLDKIMVIYHKDCTDGFASAYIFDVFADSLFPAVKVEYVPMQYGDPVPVIGTSKATRIYMLDFSLPPATVEALALSSESVWIFDHHASVMEPLGLLTNPAKNLTNLFMNLDIAHSGAGLTFNYFFNEYSKLAHEELPSSLYIQQGWIEKVSELAELVQDRDLWKFNRPNSKALHAYLMMIPKDFGAWADAVDGIFHDTIHKGFLLLEQRNQITTLLARNFYSGMLFTQPALYCNVPPEFASEVGHWLLENVPNTDVAVLYTVFGDKVKYSVRTTDNVDATKLVEQLGGGGHKNAAGAVVPIAQSHLAHQAKVAGKTLYSVDHELSSGLVIANNSLEAITLYSMALADEELPSLDPFTDSKCFTEVDMSKSIALVNPKE